MTSNVWFTSDLHLGHSNIIKHRRFDSVEEHNDTIVRNINSCVRRKDKLFILGDVVWGNRYLPLLNEINGTKELIIGNHDQLTTKEYLKYFTKVHGFRKYKDFWLSHCPIHPQEIYHGWWNIHGHIHKGGMTRNPEGCYFNVNVDFRSYFPVNFDEILAYSKEEQDKG